MSFKPSKHARCGGMWRYLTGWCKKYNPDRVCFQKIKILYCDRCFSRKAIYPKKGILRSCSF